VARSRPLAAQIEYTLANRYLHLFLLWPRKFCGEALGPPIAGAEVSRTTSGDHIVTNGLTDREGQVVLEAPSGTYQVRFAQRTLRAFRYRIGCDRKSARAHPTHDGSDDAI
jgi:hypothetical protein